MSDVNTKSTEQNHTRALLWYDHLALGFFDNWVRLLLFTIAGAAIGFGITQVLPRWYTSTTTIQLNDAGVRQAESVMRSPAVLDHLIASRVDTKGQTIEEKRRNLNKQLSWTTISSEPRKNASFFYFLAQSKDPLQAQSIARLALDKWLELVKPRPNAKERLEQHLATTVDRLADTESLHKRLSTETSSLSAPNTLQGEYATPLSKLRAERDALVDEIRKIRTELDGIGPDVIISGPDLPTEPTNSYVVQFTALGGLGGLLLAMATILSTKLYTIGLKPYLASIRRRADG